MNSVILKGVTVVDKIDLPEIDSGKEYFEMIKKGSIHFRERLLERYNINISLHQYLMLVKKIRGCKYGKFILKINDVDVWVIKRGAILVTALPKQ